MRSSHRSKAGGYTLLEMVIAVAILAGVSGSLAMNVQRGLQLYATSSSGAQLNARAGKTVLRITNELMSAGAGGMFPVLDVAGPPTFWSSSLDFRVATDWAANAPVWGPTTRLALELAANELDNGIDDNGNGLVDESDLVLTHDLGGPDERRLVIGKGVLEYLEGEVPDGGDTNGNGLEDERGLCFSLENGVLTVRMSVGFVSSNGDFLARTYTTSIRLRN